MALVRTGGGGGGGKGQDGGVASGIKVIIRVRPLLPRELMDDEVVSADEISSVVRVENDRQSLSTSFDKVFGPRATQEAGSLTLPYSPAQLER